MTNALENKLETAEPSGAPSSEGSERRHPCFYGHAHGQTGRLHLPVSPTCNIRCLFCRRSIDDGNGEGPGLARGILPLERVVETVRRAKILCRELAVVGVAGPGDALAGRHAIEALKLVKANFPDMMTCLSTNGLMLPDMAEELLASGIGHMTVTVNAVEPEILAKICGGITLNNIFISGTGASETLISRQQNGIKAAGRLGAKIKVNMVLVPGINDRHAGEIARQVSSWGAIRMNIIPLIPQFAMKELRAPSADEMDFARKEASKYIEISTHCARCRADACGIPGISDFSKWLYGGGPGGVSFSHG